MSERRPSESVLVSPGTRLPYSKGLMARTLAATGIPPERAYELARLVEVELVREGAERTVTVSHLYDVAAQVLADHEYGDSVRNLRRYQALETLDLPLLILIGGTTGTGKSTITTEVAHRLGITRVTSTDLIRQTMRAFFSSDFMPSIHVSSFEARPRDDDVDPLVGGFLEQTRNVLVGVKAVLDRALLENHSLALEGVHVVPGLVPTALEGGIVAQCLVVVEDEDEHARHFYRRDADSDGLRPNEKYLNALPDIRRLQDYLSERARNAGVPVIDNRDRESAVDAVIGLVLDAVERAGAVRT
jgi:2-phosphoglycerate kinase